MSKEILKNYLASHNLPYNERAFASYAEQLVAYNEKVNLTAVTATDDIYLKHFTDSVLGQEFIPAGANVIDIGTGAGFPGVPLKLVRPDISMTLLDSLNKRIIFLRQLLPSPEIDLGIPCFHSRAETFEKKAFYTVAVVRAVAKLPLLIKWSFPLLKRGGRLVAYKSENIADELNDARENAKNLGVSDISVYERELGQGIKRKFVVAVKG